MLILAGLRRRLLPIVPLNQLAAVVVRLEGLILLLVTPLFLFPSPLRSLALLAIPFLWLSRKLAHGRFIFRTPLDWPLALLVLMLLVSL
ncbi:MAG: hypothetical protein ACC700_20145, partial [Anaerolineales bacterium]